MSDDNDTAFDRLAVLFEQDGRQFATKHDVPKSVVGAAMIRAGVNMFGHGAEEMALWFESKARELRASLGRSAGLN